MKINHLRHFLAAAHHGSFAAAAEHINISPTSISYSVGQLEAELGASLFVRRPSKGLTLTTAGRALMQQSRHILTELEALEDRFRSRDGKFKGELVVGCQEGLSWSLLPRVMNLLGLAHPDLRISTRNVSLDDNFEGLLEGQIDILTTFAPNLEPPAGIELVPLCRAKPFVVMREGHPLDTGGSPVSLREVAKFGQVMNNEEAALRVTRDIFRSVRAEPKVDHFSNVSASVQALVGQGDALAIRFTKPISDYSPLGHRLAIRPIKEVSVQPYVVVAKVNSSIDTVRTRTDLFTDTCRELFETGVMRGHFLY